jgi:hypothetical protein
MEGKQKRRVFILSARNDSRCCIIEDFFCGVSGIVRCDQTNDKHLQNWWFWVVLIMWSRSDITEKNKFVHVTNYIFSRIGSCHRYPD